MNNSIFNPADNQLMIDRINKLTATTPAVWGKMNASQMLAHCQIPLLVAEGKVTLKRTIIGFLFGRMILKKLLKGNTLDKNSPTDKAFIISNQPDFEIEKEKTVTQIKNFGALGTSVIKVYKHPFFGELTDEQWGILSYKHFDHHLKQFGV